MKSRFSTVAGFLAAATLLSGSTFAFAPEFTADLPTVIITDRISTPSGDDWDAPNGPWAGTGGFRVSSAFLFRYDDAVDLAPIIELNDAASISDVKVVFNEFDTGVVPNTVTTLQINGADALPDLPVKADFSGADAFTAGLLSFRNIDFSPAGTDGPFDPVGDLTGDDLRITPSQSRIVTLSIDAVDSTNGPGQTNGSASFLVVTEIGAEGDRTTLPISTDPFVTVYDTGGNFDDWEVKLLDNRILGIPTNGAGSTVVASSAGTTGFTFTPAPVGGVAIGNPPPAGSTTLSVASSNAQIGLAGWGLINDPADPATGFDMEADKLYRMRATMSSSNAATLGSIYIQWGDTFNTGTINAGYLSEAFFTPFETTGTRAYPAITSTATDYETYILTREASQADWKISVLDDFTTDGQEYQLDQVVVGVANRADLGGETVLLNHGAASVTVASGERAAPAGQTAFSGGQTTVGVDWFGDSGLNGAVPQNWTITGDLISAQMGAAPAGNDYWEFSQVALYGDNILDVQTMDTGVEVTNDYIYITDVWMSTAQSGQVLPNVIIRNTVDLTQFSYTGFWVGAGTFSSLELSNTDLHLTADAKVLSNVIRPQTPNGTGEMVTNIGLLWTWDGFDQLDNTTTRIHRIAITRYDAN